MKYKFYQIKSSKSLLFDDDLRKICLVCENNGEIFFFIWLNIKNEPEKIQYVFYEKFFDWTLKDGLVIGETNRLIENVDKIGDLKGTRTLHPSQNGIIYEEGWKIIDNATFPEEFKDIITQYLKQ